MLVVLLLVVIAVLLYLRHPDRDYTLSAAVLIAALTWLAIEVHLLRLLHDLFALAVDHWVDTVIGLSALLLLIVPAIMIYVAIRDQMDERATRPYLQPVRGAVPARHSVLDKFERRVAVLMALGYSRTQAEGTALHQMKRDLSSHPGSGETSRPHAS
ncbi:MAG: hypothetical protein WCB53_08720 [Terriglobales bacterium]